MRLWSLHPAILDQKGLTAAWREGLLAQSVILKLQNGLKPGYCNHSQLQRFLAHDAPLLAIGTWLSEIWQEAHKRQYNYNWDKILMPGHKMRMTVTRGQLLYEHNHILGKLKQRSLRWFETFEHSTPTPMAMFDVIEGEIEPWEKV